jgi:hypothetical protein
MSFVRTLAKAAAGAASGVALLTALPVFGAVGAITATGLVVGSLLGASAGVADELIDARKTRKPIIPAVDESANQSRDS